MINAYRATVLVLMLLAIGSLAVPPHHVPLAVMFLWLAVAAQWLAARRSA